MIGIQIATDPIHWPRDLKQSDRDDIVMKGPPALPTNFPRDSKKREFPKNILFQKLPNGESVPRDFLVWSSSSAALLCFPCSVFGKQGAASESSLLFRWNGGIKDNWRKLYDRV